VPLYDIPLLHNAIPVFEPAFRVPRVQFESCLTTVDPLQLFLHFFSLQCIEILVNSTNNNAAEYYAIHSVTKGVRFWNPVDIPEMLRWLGMLLCMGRYTAGPIADFWSGSHGSRASHHMGRVRWQQIHRFLRINDDDSWPSTDWWIKLEPIASLVRQACKSAVNPGSWLAVDETMVKFEGRTHHNVKIKGKPIDEGFKVWSLGFDGYIWSWLWHYGREGTEDIRPQAFYSQGKERPVAKLAPTFQVPISLCKQTVYVYPNRPYIVFLDNLFLNVEVAHCLLELQVATMGTTRKRARGIPDSLLNLQEQKQHLVWNSMVAKVIDKCLVFLWQDNKALIAISTPHSLHRREDLTEVLRKRPRSTNSNRAVILPVFNDESIKSLEIPVPIDDYNHGMCGVDIVNQLRKGFSCARPFEARWTLPLLYWIIDTSHCNAFIIYRSKQQVQSSSEHATFFDT
jgi:Transposase IS4